MSDKGKGNETPWIIATILTLFTTTVALINSPFILEIYKRHNNTQEKPNPTPNSSLSKESSDNSPKKSNPAIDLSSSKESLEDKYSSSIRNAIQEYFKIRKEAFENNETSQLDNYASGERLNNLISRINQNKKDNFYEITDKQDLEIKNIQVLSDLEAESRITLVESWKRYSSTDSKCIYYYPKDDYLYDISLKRHNNKWLVDNIKTVKESLASKLNCEGPRKRTNTSGSSNTRTRTTGPGT